MGRGGMRSKASGGTAPADGPFAEKQLALNMTLFQFLQTGYFEKDLLSYCANRLAEYSCIYWLDPSVDGKADVTNLYLLAQGIPGESTVTPSSGTDVTRYPSHFINQNTTDRPSRTTIVHTLVDGQPLSGTFLGPVDLRKVFLSTNGVSVAVVESHRLPLNVIARVLLPLLLVVACVANLFVLRNTYRLSRVHWPLAVYFVYLSLLDGVDLLCRGTDFLVEAFTDIRLLTAVQFLSRGACQILTSAYSTFKHIQATLVIGLAIDTWRLSRSPEWFLARYRREWTKNVLILASALAFTADSQFFWTFDLAQLENKHIHERLVQNAYECGFITSTMISPVFIDHIWPMIDHFWGDVLPLVASAFTGVFVLLNTNLVLSNKIRCIEGRGKEAHSAVPDGDVDVGQRLPVDARQFTCSSSSKGDSEAAKFRQILQTFAKVCILQAALILPRTIYYMTKYSLFTRVRLSEDYHPEYTDAQQVEQLKRRLAQMRHHEVNLEAIESLLQYLPMVNTVLRAYLLHRGVPELKEEARVLYRRLQAVLGRRCPRLCSKYASRLIRERLGRPGNPTSPRASGSDQSTDRRGDGVVVRSLSNRVGSREQTLRPVKPEECECSYQQYRDFKHKNVKVNGLERHTGSEVKTYAGKPVNSNPKKTLILRAEKQHFQVYSF